jgi:hypothetical protein
MEKLGLINSYLASFLVWDGTIKLSVRSSVLGER